MGMFYTSTGGTGYTGVRIHQTDNCVLKTRAFHCPQMSPKNVDVTVLTSHWKRVNLAEPFRVATPACHPWGWLSGAGSFPTPRRSRRGAGPGESRARPEAATCHAEKGTETGTRSPQTTGRCPFRVKLHEVSIRKAQGGNGLGEGCYHLRIWSKCRF